MKRITYPAACVLQALARGKSYGFDIMETTELPSGTVYPMLRRFDRDGLVESSWEMPEAAHGDRRPRRRHYKLTELGRGALSRAAERYRLHLEIFGEVDNAGVASS